MGMKHLISVNRLTQTENKKHAMGAKSTRTLFYRISIFDSSRNFGTLEYSSKFRRPQKETYRKNGIECSDSNTPSKF